MTEQLKPRPPLWRAMNAAQVALGFPLPQEMAYSDAIAAMRVIRAAEIRAGAQYLLDHCPTYVDPDGKPAFRMGAGVLEVLEQEAKRAEAGE